VERRFDSIRTGRAALSEKGLGREAVFARDFRRRSSRGLGRLKALVRVVWRMATGAFVPAASFFGWRVPSVHDLGSVGFPCARIRAQPSVGRLRECSSRARVVCVPLDEWPGRFCVQRADQPPASRKTPCAEPGDFRSRRCRAERMGVRRWVNETCRGLVKFVDSCLLIVAG